MYKDDPDIYWTRRNGLKYKFAIDHHSFSMSETFKKSQMSEIFDVSAGCSHATATSLEHDIMSPTANRHLVDGHTDG